MKLLRGKHGKVSENKSRYFKRINRMYKPLTRLIKNKQKEDISYQYSEWREKNTTDLKGEYNEQLYDNKLDNLGQIDKFLERN